MRVYIEADLEGASGLWRGEQVRPSSPAAWAYGKGCLARDVNTVVDAAFANGASAVVVKDGHGPGGLDWLKVDARAAVERAGPAPETSPSLDETFDCVFLVGRHAMAGTPLAFLEHTQSSRNWFDFKINGRSQGEIGQLICYAGHYHVPAALVTGDRAACAEAERLFPGIVTAEVKTARCRSQATCYPPEHCRLLLRERTAEAMEKVRAGRIAPWIPDKPMSLELTVQRVELADEMDQRWRTGPRTFRKQIDDQRLVVRF